MQAATQKFEPAPYYEVQVYNHRKEQWEVVTHGTKSACNASRREWQAKRPWVRIRIVERSA
jgi:hypothetical protein